MMRTLFTQAVCSLSLLLIGGTSASISAQQQLDQIPARNITLFSQAVHRDHNRSRFSFRLGLRGDLKTEDLTKTEPVDNVAHSNETDEASPYPIATPSRRPDTVAPASQSEDVPRLSGNLTELRYGGITDNGNNHWFDVSMQAGSRSQLKDLGEMTWSDVLYVPYLSESPLPHSGGVKWSYSDGKLVNISPEGVNVRAVTGHMYLLRVKDQAVDFYVMFRVESLVPEGECTISWKRVPAPGS